MNRRRSRRPLRRPAGPSWVTWANLAMMAVVLVVVVLSRGPVADAVNSMFEQVADGSGEGSGEVAAVDETVAPPAHDPVAVRASVIARAHQRVAFAAQLAFIQSNRSHAGDASTDP